MSAPKLQVIDTHDFPYPALETPDSVRLLTLVGVKGGTPSFRLETAALETKYNYIALSYEWGTSTATEYILVNGRPFKIRSNLYGFIVWTLPKLHRRQIFIDAICINQQDTSEKQVQVALMGRVYAQAADVIAWLESHPPLDRSDVPLSQLLDEYQTEKSAFHRRVLRQECAARLDRVMVKQEEITRRLRHLLDDLAEEWRLRLAKLRKTMPNISSFDALDESLCPIEETEFLDLEMWRTSFDATYWTRCWIVQELALARSLTLQLGNQTISAELYHLLTSAMLPGESFGIEGSLGVADEIIFGSQLDVPIQEIGLLRGVETSAFEPGVRRARNVLNLRQQYQQTLHQSVDLSLHVAVEKTCKQQCSHPHDHVFSLLGIASTNVNVDYEIDLILLYIYVLAEGLRDLLRGDKAARHYHPWKGPNAFMIAFHYSMAQPAVWVVTSLILQLYEPGRVTRAFYHHGLFISQALWSDRFAFEAGVPRSMELMYLVLRPVLSLVTALWYCFFHSYNRWRGKLVSGPAPDGVILGYHQWETVIKRVHFSVQNDEPLRWRSVREVLAGDRDADRSRTGERRRLGSR